MHKEPILFNQITPATNKQWSLDLLLLVFFWEGVLGKKTKQKIKLVFNLLLAGLSIKKQTFYYKFF